MTDFHDIIANVSKRFQEVYRMTVLDRWRSGGSSEDKDDIEFKTLLQSNQFARELVGLYQSLCFRYENDLWYSEVLDTLDLDLIYANVDKAIKENKASEEEYQDYLVKELLRYFKQDFFTWCNKPRCVSCGNDEQQEAIGMDQPSSEEARYQCGPVEIYRCKQHGTTTRFPRYNDPLKLLQTRTGRCGEWCNLFTLILKSFGLNARYIWNKEDHVWCEFYSDYLKKWVHLDSCEQSFDEPHIYSINWNKKMSYAIAFSHDSVTDVSSRYIIKNKLPRDEITEKELDFLCNYLTKSLRKSMTDDELYSLACRDEQERLEWYKTKQISIGTPTTSSAQGRQSGSADWKKTRGEDGLS